MDHASLLSNAAALPGAQDVLPSFERYTNEVLLGDLWKRPHLSVRDRSVITLSVLIARNQSAEMPFYLNVALDHGVTPGEISAMVAHLAFYSGWANAMAAVDVVRAVFHRRGMDATPFASINAGPHPVDEQLEQRRHAAAMHRFGQVAPGLVQLTSDVLFQDVWRSPELSLRDRCLITICSVIATAQTAQLAFYVNRALDHCVSRAELSELLTHIAFYSGWSSAYTALAVVKDVFESRPD
jgi:4-carboxymuconolactone decarboxylase